MTRYLLLTVVTVAVLIGCSEDGSQFPLISRRGDDGREFLYRWPDSDTMENWIYNCTVSPDASEVAFEVNIENGYYGYDLAVYNLNSGECRLIREGESLNPVWSKGGEWIAFGSSDGPGDLHNLWLISPDGSRLRGAIWDEESETYPLQSFNLSPDKYLFCYTIKAPNPNSGSNIGIYEADTGDYYTITAGIPDFCYYSGAALSADDEWVALSEHIGAEYGEEPYYFAQLSYFRTDGSDHHIEIRETVDRIHGAPVDWSPDGRYLLFWVQSFSSEYYDIELWTYEKETGVFKQLTMAPEGYYHPSGNLDYEMVYGGDWANDGYIYFSSDGKLWRIKGPI